VTGTTELSREQIITINQIIEGYDKAKAPGTGYVTKVVIHPAEDLSVDVVFHIARLPRFTMEHHQIHYGKATLVAP